MRILTLAVAALMTTPAAAQTSPAPAPTPAPAPAASTPAASAALTTRAAELVPMLNGGGDVTAMFHPAFLAQVPEAQLRGISAQVTGAIGKAVRVASLVPASAKTAQVTIATERGAIMLQLAIEEAAPNRIVGLRITGTTSAEASVPALIDTLKGLPGQTSLAIYDLGPGAPKLVQGHNPQAVLPVGSAFKLVILAELVRQIEAGQRKWDDTITLDGRELPAGGFNQLPKGSAVPIRGLAEKMISVSDNSATDLLLFALGREKVEAMQKTLGVADPARNRPFLSTMEAFKVKGIARLRDRWLAGDEKTRRAMLPEIDAAPTSELSGLFADGKPIAPDRIEWFYSPLDMARIMDWLRQHSESGAGAEARRILAINPGIGPTAAKGYGYVGYKGGSEPGLINMTLLLQRKQGGWRVLTGTWLNPAAAVEDARFAGLISRAAELSAE